MRKHFTASILTGSLLLLATAARAQVAYSLGPVASFNVSGASNNDPANTTLTYRAGFEAGAQGILQFGHLAVQPSLRFSQKGLHRHYGHSSGSTETDYRLHYLTLPINIAYSLRADGQGLQVFAGPYAGLLLGGNYQYVSNSSYGGSTTTEGHISSGDYYTIPTTPTADPLDYLFRQLDMGLQTGLGYRSGKLLAQANFSFGLRTLAPTFPSSYNRAAQVSLSYLFAPQH